MKVEKVELITENNKLVYKGTGEILTLCTSYSENNGTLTFTGGNVSLS